MARYLGEFADAGLINIAGGCCGNTPEHIAAIAKALDGPAPARLRCRGGRWRPPRPSSTAPEPPRPLRLSGSQPFTQQPGVYMMIGERTNVAGSPKFAKLIKEGKYEEAVSVARQQVENGANVIDICMDEGMIDGVAAMTRFLLAARQRAGGREGPVHGRLLEVGGHRGRPQVPAGQGHRQLDLAQGRRGEVPASTRAPSCSYGAAVVVMAFDEQGQAATYDDKIRICERAYRILVDEVGFPPEDIIFDPNILTVATGIEEHNNYAVDFIEATRWIKANLPHAKVSGGVSNISFSFRGNNHVREAMHSAFLYHAIQAGMDMGIVNAGMLEVYEEIPSRAARARRGRAPQPPPRRDRAAGRLRREAEGRERRRGRRREEGRGVAQRHRRGAAVARAGQGHRHVHRRRHRGGARRSSAGRSRSSKGR